MVDLGRKGENCCRAQWCRLRALVGDAGIREIMCPVKALGEYILRTGNAIWWVLLDGWEDVRTRVVLRTWEV
jgi:hypothetical protein